jgi:hypothetical protein
MKHGHHKAKKHLAHAKKYAEKSAHHNEKAMQYMSKEKPEKMEKSMKHSKKHKK